MNKLVIGIFPQVLLPHGDNPFLDTYNVINNYPKRVYQADAIPVGLLLNDGKISTEQLELCDAFILPGGKRIDPSIYYLLQYAYDNNKPVLGICMGMQEMIIYSVLKDVGVNPFEPDKYKEAYDNMKNDNPVLHKLINDENHYHKPVADLDSMRHHIKIDDNSLLSNLYNAAELNVVSIHGVEAKRKGSILNVVAYSDDGVIEAVENKDLLWIGLQFHPEIDDKDILIKKFIEEIERRK